MKKRNIFLVVAILCLVIAGINIGSTGKHNKIVIGVIAPQTGGGAAFGASFVKGVELAVKDYSLNDVEVVYEDDGGDATKAASAAKKLINVDGAQVILTVTGTTANAIKSIAEDASVVHIADTADPTVGSGDYNFTNSIVPTDEMPAWLLEASKRNIKRVAILYQNHPGIIPSVSLVQKLASSYGIEVAFIESFDGKQGDFKTLALKASQSKADMYFVAAYPPSLDIVSKNLIELGITNISTYSLFAISPTPALYNGKWYTDANLADVSFKERFENEYPNIRFNVRTAPYGYDMFNLAVSAIKSGNASEYLKQLTSFSGKVGTVIKDVGGNSFRSSPAVWAITEGVPELLNTIEIK